MPFARQPQEPSPRLLALLSGQPSRATARDAQAWPADDIENGPEEEGLDGDLAWVPTRADIDGSSSPRDTDPADLRAMLRGLALHPGDPAVGGRGAAPRTVGRHRRPRAPSPPVLSLPRALVSARVGPRPSALVGFGVVLVCAALVFGVRVAWARAESRPVPIPAAVTSTATQRSGLEPLAPFRTRALGPDPTSDARGQVMVHVVGQVRRPGVVALPTGSRVADAVTAAGGALRRADLTVLNLARLLVDGEQIRVPKPGESVTLTPGTSTGSGAAPHGAPVNLNTADLATLDTLPGVGPVLAQRILDWRAEHGRFSTVEELGEVSGIGEKLLAQLAPRVTV